MTRDMRDQRAIDTLRQDVTEAIRERNLYRLMFRAALDQLALVATAPERAEQIQRELRREREVFMTEALAREVGR